MFFFTVVTAGRQPVFADPVQVARLRAVTKAVRARLPFDIVAAVVLPDHLHSLWQLPPEDGNYATRWGLIKAGFTRGNGLPDAARGRPARGERGVWQPRYWEHRIRDDRDLSNHLDYIHFNPVRHGLCAAPWEWPWSSFGKWVRLGMYPSRWEMPTPPTVPHSRFDP
nr:transposase [Oleisolibacter albus]